jgi:hypothetical protein
MKKPFEYYIAIIEDALECKLFDWQKNVLRCFYDGNHHYVLYGRCCGFTMLDTAVWLLYEMIEKENWYENFRND